MKTINAKEFKNLLKNNNNFQIIDIREPYEYEDGALTNENIPLDKMMSSLNKIHRDRPVIIYCQTGKRASAIIYMLEKEYKLENLYNLEGGYNAIQNMSRSKLDFILITLKGFTMGGKCNTWCFWWYYSINNRYL